MQVIETIRGHFDFEEDGIAYCALWAQNDKNEWDEFEAECDAKLLYDSGIQVNRGFFVT